MFFSRIEFELFINNLSYLQPYNKLDKIKHEPQTQMKKKIHICIHTYIHTYFLHVNKLANSKLNP